MVSSFLKNLSKQPTQPQEKADETKQLKELREFQLRMNVESAKQALATRQEAQQQKAFDKSLERLLPRLERGVATKDDIEELEKALSSKFCSQELRQKLDLLKLHYSRFAR